MRLLICLLLMLFGPRAALAEESARPTPPPQAADGPGGREYAFDSVLSTRYGRGAETVWVFQPRGGVDGPRPVVVFLHGLNAVSYQNYWLWVRHLVRRGNIVIYPEYQRFGLIDPTTFTGRAAEAVRTALDRLDSGPFAKPDREKVALVGHSLGGTMAVNLAARPEHYGLPAPKAVMAVQPGDVRTKSGLAAFLPSLMEDPATIPAGTLMLVVASDNDWIVGQDVAQKVFYGAERVAADDKDYILVHGDDSGEPALIADHFLPLSYVDVRGIEHADAIDFALWRWFDALTDAAFYDGKHRAYALGNTPEQRAIGRWSDGTQVREVTVTDEP